MLFSIHNDRKSVTDQFVALALGVFIWIIIWIIIWRVNYRIYGSLGTIVAEYKLHVT